MAPLQVTTFASFKNTLPFLSTFGHQSTRSYVGIVHTITLILWSSEPPQRQYHFASVLLRWFMTSKEGLRRRGAVNNIRHHGVITSAYPLFLLVNWFHCDYGIGKTKLVSTPSSPRQLGVIMTVNRIRGWGCGYY